MIIGKEQLEKLKGKRVLIRRLDTSYIFEAKIVEISPSGAYIKVKMDYAVQWISLYEHVILEVLD